MLSLFSILIPGVLQVNYFGFESDTKKAEIHCIKLKLSCECIDDQIKNSFFNQCMTLIFVFLYQTDNQLEELLNSASAETIINEQLDVFMGTPEGYSFLLLLFLSHLFVYSFICLFVCLLMKLLM